MKRGAFRHRLFLLCVMFAPIAFASDRTAPTLEPYATSDSEPPALAEEFHYRWRLTNLLGHLAGLVFPRDGLGVLIFRTDGHGHVISELEITSEKSAAGEFWRYGAEIDPLQQRTVKAWSSYRYGEKSKTKETTVDQRGVVDVASGILHIRRSLPAKPERLSIWSDGRIYPVEIIPKGLGPRRVGPRTVSARSYVIRGVEVPGQRFWKGSLELWLSQDSAATPVAILLRRGGIGFLLELQAAT